ncbi:hypothetical protein DH2020_029663 [Rehmannia glutinosa]|uniref:arginine--tRNA ligase n=1 Tax=Rehmannia glutinosa TaxID=99300 RepID=A0ABR0VPM9_REHGL
MNCRTKFHLASQLTHSLSLPLFSAFLRYLYCESKFHSKATFDINDGTWRLKQQLEKLFEESFRTTIPDEPDVEPAIAPCQDPKFGDYQCNNAMGLWAKVKGKGTQFKGPYPIAESIHKMLIYGIETWAPELPVKRAVVDFSSPNIAKEMHVGHLRSTIIGDTLARMLEYSKVEVLRRNHVGDWGTQVHTSLKLSMPMLLGLLGMKRGFGMLIEYLFEKFPSGEVSDDQAIGDLEAFYKASKQRFDSDPVFKERAQRAVVGLQGGEEKYRKAWAQICEISRRGYERVYQRLGVHIEEKGESFYNSYIPGALELLNEKGLIEESEGARVIFIEGKNIPLIVVKRDGGYNYASTDLAALWYRLNEEKAEWIIYLTDVGQRAFRNGLYCNSETVKLVDLLDEAKSRCKEALVQRGKAEEWTAEELDRTAEAVGYGAVNTVEQSLFLQRSEHTGHPNTCLSLVLLCAKFLNQASDQTRQLCRRYADLKNNRTTNYTFSFDQMLNDKGNTAVYLLYAHARICSIIRRSGKDIEELKKTGTVELAHADERVLGLDCSNFQRLLKRHAPIFYQMCCVNICTVCLKIQQDFTPVVRSLALLARASRLLLCEATAVVMRQCFYLLGLTPSTKSELSIYTIILPANISEKGKKYIYIYISSRADLA